MKWAKTKSEILQIRKRLLKLPGFKVLSKPSKSSIASMIQQEITQCYVEIEDSPNLKAMGFGQWTEVQNLPSNFRAAARARYEAFVGGFVYFFEKHTEYSQQKERTIYFDWGKSSLTIYMKPFFNKPMPPIPESSGQESKEEGNPQQNGKSRLKNSNKRSVLRKGLQKLSIAPSPAIEGTDPPPPPPPPPPPRE